MAAADAAKAIALLDELTKDKPSSPGDAAYLLNPKLLAKAKAVQFVFTEKKGLVVGVSSGSGFALTKLASAPDGTATWSPPLFLSSGSISLGITVGAQSAGSLSLFLSDSAAEYLVSHGSVGPSLDADIHLTLKQNWPTHGASLDALLLEDVVSLGLADGVMADLSGAVGKVRVAAEANQAAYGAGSGPQEVLAPAAPEKVLAVPPEFLPLFDKLNQIILTANQP